MKLGYMILGFMLSVFAGIVLREIFPPKNVSEIYIITLSSMAIAIVALFCYLKVKKVGFVRYGTYWILGASLAFFAYGLASPLDKQASLDYFRLTLSVNFLFAYTMAKKSWQH